MMVSLFSFENLHRAYLNCRKGKRNSRCALLFEQQLEENLFQLCKELQERTYQPAPSSCFITSKPKHREIFAADFHDRVIHHLVVSHLEPIWEKTFIHDSFACRRNKGTHGAVFRLQDFMRSASSNGVKTAYFLHIDIKSYFLSIDKEILYRILCKRIHRLKPCWMEEMKWLVGKIVFHDPTVKAQKRGQLSLFDLIPPHKSMSSTSNKTGLPIGNYTSQFFANVYLDRLDQFVKHGLKASYYLRYVDDLVLLDEDRKRLEAWEESIDLFLKRDLKLQLHPHRRTLASVSNGCDFLGYVVRRTHLLARRRTVQNCREKLRHYEAVLVRKMQRGIHYRYAEQRVSQLFATLMSYQGQFCHTASFRLWRRLFDEFPYLRFYVRCSRDHWIRKDQVPKRFGSLAAQYQWFARKFRNCLMFFQVGCFFEFYGPQAKRALALVRLKAGRTRRSLGLGVGVPMRCGKLAELQKSGLDVPIAVVRQTGRPLGRTAQRRVAALYVRPKPSILQVRIGRNQPSATPHTRH
jgi:hypothetical protein